MPRPPHGTGRPRPAAKVACRNVSAPSRVSRSVPVLTLRSVRLPSGPWVFARDAGEPQPRPDPGAWVEVRDREGRYVGHGLWNPASDVRVRLLSRGRRSEARDVAALLERRLAAALRLRRKVLRLEQVTDAYRVVHAEGDDLSGLVVDRLGPVVVCEHHALGFWRLRETLERVLVRLLPGGRVLHRAAPRSARAEGFDPGPEPQCEEIEIHEHGLHFRVVPAGGHKTGWFCDQRDNRRRVAALAAGRRVLDVCCNVGGFALSCAASGAREVRAVDLDERAVALARRSALAAGLAIEWFHEDAFDHLRRVRDQGPRPELLVLDPPKLVFRRGDEAGMRKLSDLNTLAFEALAPGGLLATFSCSGALPLAEFVGLVFRAARRAERSVRLLEVTGAAPDHPQRPDFARSRYLTGLFLALDA